MRLKCMTTMFKLCGSQVVAETGCNHVPIPSNITALFVAVHDDVHKLVFKAFRIVKSHIALQVMHYPRSMREVGAE